MDRFNITTSFPLNQQMLDEESIAVLLRKVPTAATVNSAIALLAWAAIPTHIPPYWLFVILAASLLRFIPVWLAKKTPSIVHEPLYHWLLLGTIILQGIGWGYGSTLLFLLAPQMQKFLVLTIICGMVGGSTLTLAPSSIASLCFALPATIPLVVVMFFTQESTFQYASGMGVVFIVAIYLLSRETCHNHLALLTSRRSLEEASEELIRHQQHLEQVVDSRTREVEESKEKYRQLIEEINDAIYEIDDKGNIRYVSPAITPLLGYHPDELIGKNVRQITYKDDLELIMFRISAVLNGEEQYAIDSRFVTKEGGICWLRITSQAVIFNGRAIGLRGIATDINREKRVEEDKIKLAQAIQQARKLESIGTLAGGIAHDFNNLLMGIQGRATLLAMDYGQSHPHLEHTKAIEKYVANGAELTKQLLATGKGGKYDPKPLDITTLVHESITLFGRTKKELEIEISLPENPVVANVDGAQIEQVLLNMYVNSSQAMPQGGSLKISVREKDLQPTFCRPYQIEPGPYIEISISDSGIGMEQTTLERIFDPFFTTKEMGRGTGLGLSSAHGIISNHHGCITVESSLNQGTTFSIYLPRSASQPVTITDTTSTPFDGKETILLVDDEEMIIEVAGAILTRLGYTVITARDGFQAIRLLKEHGESIHLVLLDMIMPGMDGSSTFDELRALRPNLPVLLSSGYSLNDQAMEILQRGCNGFIEKPFTLDSLSAKIRSILGTQLN